MRRGSKLVLKKRGVLYGRLQVESEHTVTESGSVKYSKDRGPRIITYGRGWFGGVRHGIRHGALCATAWALWLLRRLGPAANS